MAKRVLPRQSTFQKDSNMRPGRESRQFTAALGHQFVTVYAIRLYILRRTTTSITASADESRMSAGLGRDTVISRLSAALNLPTADLKLALQGGCPIAGTIVWGNNGPLGSTSFQP
jgi:hypothetical protein